MGSREGFAFALASSLLFGISVVLNKSFLVSLDFLPFLWFRFVFLSLFFFLLIHLRKQTDFRKFDQIQWLQILGMSVLFFLFSLLFYYGLKDGMPSHAMFFYIGFPVLSTLLDIVFFKGTVSVNKFISSAVFLLGFVVVYLSVAQSTDMWNPGVADIFLVSGVFVLSVEKIVNRKSMIKPEDRFMVSFLKYGLGLVGLGVILFLNGSGFSWGLVGYSFISSFLAVLSIVLWDYSNRISEVKDLILPVFLGILVGFGMSLIVFHEPVPVVEIIGFLVIFASLWMGLRKSSGKVFMFDA